MRLGVFGGTFDPIHYGHLRIAEEARWQVGLDRVLFVPNAVSPLKTGGRVTSGAGRAEMVQRAIADNPWFALDTCELDRTGPSYSVDTMRAFRAAHPDAELFFLTGADAVRDLRRWREPEALLELAKFVVARRPGVSRDEIVDALPSAWLERILFLETPELDISATDLRRRIGEGRSVRYLMPPTVDALIRERGLYQLNESAIVV